MKIERSNKQAFLSLKRQRCKTGEIKALSKTNNNFRIQHEKQTGK